MSNLSQASEIQKTIRLFVRYGVVGIASNLVAYFIYIFITYLGVDPKKTMTLLYVSGAAIGFWGNKRWAFLHSGATLTSGVRYLVAHLCGYLINLFLLLTFADKLGYPHQWVQAVAIVIVAAFLFVAFRYFVFPKSAQDAVSEK